MPCPTTAPSPATRFRARMSPRLRTVAIFFWFFFDKSYPTCRYGVGGDAWCRCRRERTQLAGCAVRNGLFVARTGPTTAPRSAQTNSSTHPSVNDPARSAVRLSDQSRSSYTCTRAKRAKNCKKRETRIVYVYNFWVRKSQDNLIFLFVFVVVVAGCCFFARVIFLPNKSKHPQDFFSKKAFTRCSSCLFVCDFFLMEVFVHTDATACLFFDSRESCRMRGVFFCRWMVAVELCVFY